MEFSVHFSEEEEKLIKKYTKAKNISVSEFIRDSVLEKIEDEIDREIYNRSMAKLSEEETISFDEMLDELGMR